MCDGKITQDEKNTYLNIMLKEFQTDKEYAEKLLNEAPEISDIDSFLKDIVSIIPTDKKDMLIDSLIAISYSDGEYHQNEKDFIKKVKEAIQKNE